MATVHLHTHSWYSFGRGTASPEALCLAAARQGIEAIALTDLDGLYGVPDFLVAAHRHGIHPVLGAALPDRAVPRSAGSGRAVVLARDPQGWTELARLISARHAAPRAPLTSFLETLSDHVWILSPDLALLKAVRRVRGTDRLLAELRAGTRWERLADEATALGLGVVGTAAAQLADPSERRFQRLLFAVREKRPFARVARWELASERGWLLDEGAMKAAFGRRPDALERAAEVARDCRCGADGDPVRLALGVPSRDDAGRELSERVRAALGARWGALEGRRQDRLERELRVLTRGTRPEHLLLLADLAGELRTHGRLALPGPGLASSVVAWALELTPEDPTNLGLHAERLCCEELDGQLDADLLVADAVRPAVVRALERRLGAACVGAPARFDRWGLRDAVRDIARSAALRPSECERVLRQLPADWRGEGPDELLARCPRLSGAGIDEEPWSRILKAAARLAGAPRGVERGEGVVVSGRPLVERVPSEHVRAGLVLQWDQAGARALGLLATALPVDRAASLVLRAANEEPVVAGDGAGSALGCPDLEQPDARARLRGDGVPAVIEALEEAEPAELWVARARDEAGLSWGEAERLRRVTRASPAERAWLRRRFVEGVLAAGAALGEASLRWDALVRGLRGADSRAERVPTAVGALRCLEIGRVRPERLLSALLEVPGGAYPRWVYVAGARRQGVTVLPPSVQAAEVGTSCPATGVTRLGLGRVHGVREQLAADIVSARRERLFQGFQDFLDRVPAGVDEVDALVAAGALDDVDASLSRAELRVLHRRLRWAGGAPVQAPGGGDVSSRRAATLRDELGALGFTVSGHPIEIVAEQVPDDVVQGAALSRCVGSRVRVAAWLASTGAVEGGLHRTWRCEWDDGTALFGARMPERALGGAALAGPWLLEGEVRERRGQPELVVEVATRLDPEGAAGVSAPDPLRAPCPA